MSLAELALASSSASRNEQLAHKLHRKYPTLCDVKVATARRARRKSPGFPCLSKQRPDDSHAQTHRQRRGGRAFDIECNDRSLARTDSDMDSPVFFARHCSTPKRAAYGWLIKHEQTLPLQDSASEPK